MLVVPAVVATVVRLDERRLKGVRLERAWPPVSRDAVIFASWQFSLLFGLPALFVWFVRTRRSLFGVLQGLAAAGLLFAAAYLSVLVPALVIDWLGL
jgi:hypothetical protein